MGSRELLEDLYEFGVLNVHQYLAAVARDQQRNPDKKVQEHIEVHEKASSEYQKEVDRASRILDDIVADVLAELSSATVKFPAFNSAHEGYAIIREELDELWEEVKNNKNGDALDRQKKEAIQVAAMALRFLFDISAKGKYKNDRT